MFRRNQAETSPQDAPMVEKVGGKGRPTPTRKEAEAAARARARVPRNRKEQRQRQREVKSESSQRIRAAMKAGDERFLLPRDKGPVRRFVRDFVDSRFTIVELVIPLLIVALVLGYSGNPTLMALSTTVMLATTVVTVLDLVLLRRRLRKELERRFPEASYKGTTYYAFTRTMQLRFMRLPKAQRKIGEELPDTYR